MQVAFLSQTYESHIKNDEEMVLLWLRQHKQTTKKNYNKIISQFLFWWSSVSTHCYGGTGTLKEVHTGIIEQYKVNLLERYKQNTVRAKLGAIKSLFSYATKCGYLVFNPAAPVKNVREQDTLHERILEMDEVKALVNAISNQKYRLVAKLMFGLGLRISEALGLRWQDIKAERLTVFGKGGKVRVLILPPYLLKELKAIKPPAASTQDFIFATKTLKAIDRFAVHRAIKKAAKLSQVNPHVSCHWFRHTNATEAVNQLSQNGNPGLNLKLISVGLGHSSLATTTRYLHVRPNDCHSLYLPQI